MLTAETRTVTEGSLTTSAQTQNIQNPANIKLLQSILDRNDDNFDEALDEGADPNASGLFLPNRKKPKMAPPLLILALVQQNHAQAMTLIERGAKVDVYGDDGAPAIQMVVELFGDESLVPLMIDQEPALLDQGGNLLMGALVSFNSLTMLRKMSLLEDKSFLNSFDDYFEGKTRIPPTPPSELYYTSNTAMIELLLKRAAYQVHRKVARADVNGNVKADISPFELVQNPRKYVQLFQNYGLGCHYLAEETLKEPDPKVLLFEVQFVPAWAAVANKTEKASIPWIRVRYDFNPLYKRLELINPFSLATDAAHHQQQAQQQALQFKKEQLTLTNGLQVVTQEHVLLKNRVDSLYQEISSDHPHFEAIRALREDPLKGLFYNNCYKHLAIMMNAYQMMSTNMAQRTQNTALDGASFVLGFVAGHIPAPFSAAFALMSIGVQCASDQKERKRYNLIKDILPGNIQATAQELGYQLTLFVMATLEKNSMALERLSQLQVEALAKRAFVCAIYSLHTIKEKAINFDVRAPSPKEAQLIQHILATIANPSGPCLKFMNQLIAEQKQVQVVQSLYTPGFDAANKTSTSSSESPTKSNSPSHKSKAQKEPKTLCLMM